ncbi:MAG: hypothetical protein AAB567_02725 [Patescibacteria group bacterium]
MLLSDRQKDILTKTVSEYIYRAAPVSSRLLEEQCDLRISSATIRNELQVLKEKGFLTQPHFSAGSIPTDRGYRFFVDEISKQNGELPRNAMEEEHRGLQEIRDYVGFLQLLSRNLASCSSDLVVAYLPRQNIVWKEGWEMVLREPEFERKEYTLHFTKFISDVAARIRNFKTEKLIHIYIGKENPFSDMKEFSIILAEYSFLQEKGVISITGPKRMAYQTNIRLIKSLVYPHAKRRQVAEGN